MRNPNRQTLLDWRDPDDVRWEELPADLRDRVRELLGRLLRQVARRGGRPQEAPDET